LQFAAGRALGAMPVGLGPMSGLPNPSAVNRNQLNVQGLQLNAPIAPVRPANMDQRINPLTMNIQNAALQQRSQTNPPGFLRPMNALNLGNGPISTQLNASLGAGFAMGTSPGRGNPVAIHAGINHLRLCEPIGSALLICVRAAGI
jgi:hypothetical protein